MKYIVSIIGLFLVICSYATGYKYEVITDTVPSTGFYKINLSPYIASLLNSELTDIRIYDHNKTEIPYVIKKENFNDLNFYITHYVILKNTLDKKRKFTRIVIDNTLKKECSEFKMFVRNTQVTKNIILKGSDDFKNWYIISNTSPEVLDYNQNNTLEIWKISFPPSNYKYFEITIPNQQNDPVQVLHVGYTNFKIVSGSFTTIPNPVIFRKDSLKTSYFTIVFDKKYKINRLEFEIDKPEYFMREAQIGTITGTQKHFVNLKYFTISSQKTNEWETEAVLADTLQLIIENKDNIPLSIKSVKAWQLNCYIIAKFQGRLAYKLVFGNKNIEAPQYDLTYFSDLIPSNLNKLSLNEVNFIQPKITERNLITHKNYKPYFLWGIILIVGGLLVIISIKMLHEKKD